MNELERFCVSADQHSLCVGISPDVGVFIVWFVFACLVVVAIKWVSEWVAKYG